VTPGRGYAGANFAWSKRFDGVFREVSPRVQRSTQLLLRLCSFEQGAAPVVLTEQREVQGMASDRKI